MSANSPFSMMEIPEAGKNKFDEMLYAQKLGKALPDIRTNATKWYAFAKGRGAWLETEKERFRSEALAVLPREHRLVRNAKSVLDHVEFSSQLKREEELHGAARFEGEDKQSVLLNVANGVLRVTAQKVELLPHKKDYLFTGALRAAWDEQADCPLFYRVLGEALPDALDQQVLSWFAGYCLYPSVEHEKFLLCFGKGGDGKSTISQAVMSALGTEPLVTSLSLSQICAEGQGAYSLPGLQYALVNLGTDLDTVKIGDSANFKRMVSGETIEARTIYGKPFQMAPPIKLWFNSNSLPRFKHGTNAELRRSIFLHFDQTFVEKGQEGPVKDTTLKDKLPLERDGILGWMVQALQSILAGATVPTGSVKSEKLKARFAVSNDPVTAFVDQCCVLDAESVISKADLYEEFGGFMDAWGFARDSKEHLYRQFYERFPHVAVFRVYATDTTGLAAGRYLRGIGLKEQKE